MLNINQKTTKELYYKQVLTILSHMPPFNTLRRAELDVLALLMFYYNELVDKYKNVAKANSILFDKTYRSEIIDEIMVNKEIDDNAYEKAYAKFANILSSFRRKGFIVKGKNSSDTLNPKFIVNPEKVKSIKFNFILKNQ